MRHPNRFPSRIPSRVPIQTALRKFAFALASIVGHTLLFSTLAFNARAEIIDQPTTVIEATPLSSFSERAGLWPSQEEKDIDLENGARPLSDQLNSIPGVQSRESGSPTLSIRGSAQADRVLKLYDGIPLNLADGVGGSDLFVPSETIGSIRILKGPSSVFYGGSAMGGAVDFRSRFFERPGLRLNVADDTGVIGPHSVFAETPFSKNSREGEQGLQATAFYERRPGHYQYDSASGYGSGRLDHNWSETTRGTISGEKQLGGGMLLRPRLIIARGLSENPGALYSPAPTSSDLKGTLASLEFSTPVFHGAEMSVRASDVRINGTYDRGTGFESESSSARTGLMADLDALLFERLQMRTFVDVNAGRFSATYLAGQNFNDQQFEAGQVYQIPLLPALSLEPGFRYRAESGDWLKSVGLVHDAGSLRAWGLYSEGYRAPSLSDRFSQTSYFVGNPGLQAERSRGAEVGFMKSDAFSFGTALYDTEYYDLVETISVSQTTTSKTNTGHARSLGLEINVGYEIESLRLEVSYNNMHATNTDNGEPLRLAPRHQLNARLSFKAASLVWEIEETYWSSYFDREFPSNALKELPSWNTVNLKARTSAMMDWEIEAGILNIFDQPRDLTLGFPEPQRRLYVSVMRFF